MSLSKKGAMSVAAVVAILITIAAGGVAIYLTIKSGKLAGDIGRDEACRLSILTAAGSKKIPSISGPPGTGRPYIPLNCPRENIVLKYKDIVENNKVNQDKAHRIIADEMYSCWRKMGEGKIDPFSNWDVKGESYCLICGVIKFDDRLEDFVRKKSNAGANVEDYMIRGFLPYMMKTQIPIKKISYYGAVFGKKSTTEDLKKAEEDARNAIILPGSTVIMQMYKLESKSSFVGYRKYIIVGAGATLGVVSLLFPPSWPAWGVVLGAVAPRLVAAGLTTVSAYGLSDASGYAFKDCEDCNGVGAIHFIPAAQAFNEKIELSYKDKDGNEKTVKTNLCTVLVN